MSALGQGALQVPQVITKVKIHGVLKPIAGVEAREITQEVSIKHPQGFAKDGIAMNIWQSIHQFGGLTIKPTEDEYLFFPMHEFEKLYLEFSSILTPQEAGVTLA